MITSTSHDDLSDDDLWQRVTGGDRVAFERVYKRYGHRVLAFATSICRPPIDPHEVAQVTWLKAWQRRHLKLDGLVMGWLLTIARNVAMDAIRRAIVRRTSQLDSGEQPAPMEDATRAEELAALRECLQELGGDFVAVLKLKLTTEASQSDRDIAARLGIAEGTVASRANRGRVLVKHCIEQKLKSS